VQIFLEFEKESLKNEMRVIMRKGPAPVSRFWTNSSSSASSLMTLSKSKPESFSRLVPMNLQVEESCGFFSSFGSDDHQQVEA